MQSWDECHAAGMTAAQAAKAMGKSDVTAHKWAKEHGKRWSRLTSAQLSERIRSGAAKARAKVPAQKLNVMGERRNEAPILPPEQDRQGGKFWMVNSKSGEKLFKASTAGIYLEAQLRGWVDWEWGAVE